MQSIELPTVEAEPKGAEAALLQALGGDRGYLARYRAITSLSRRVRSSEYLLTNACNIRCQGCWFFGNRFDTSTKELTAEGPLREFVQRERKRGINYAIIIGGEPTLIPKRIALFVEEMDYVTISTNGLRPFPIRGFERVAVQISLFGGGPLDDELRAIKPSGERFTGLFERTLSNFKDDPRACFVFAICDEGVQYIDETVRRIRDNGNRVTFNVYSKYGTSDPLRAASAPRLLETALAVKERYPETVLSHPYFIETLVTGKTHWGESFSYRVCPSISVDHPAHAERKANGNPSLPLFNAWAADCSTVNFCCTSGHCDECRDSQAVLSWLQLSMYRFRESPELLKTWIEIAESYWHQFPWALGTAPEPARAASPRALPIHP
ncbi:MAG TPA: radical SAM protein [Polyangiaceae bacterium]|nr:radical SAM protein [Polyangiaceae bacterium]